MEYQIANTYLCVYTNDRNVLMVGGIFWSLQGTEWVKINDERTQNCWQDNGQRYRY